MKTTELLLLGILVTLFGGFIWLRGNVDLSSSIGYWLMVAGLVIGAGGVVINSIRTQRYTALADES